MLIIGTKCCFYIGELVGRLVIGSVKRLICNRIATILLVIVSNSKPITRGNEATSVVNKLQPHIHCGGDETCTR